MKYQFHKSPGEVIPIVEISELFISTDDVAKDNLNNHLYQSVLNGELIPRTANCLPRSVESCVEQAKSLPVAPWIMEYLGMVPGAFKGMLVTPYAYLTSNNSELWLRQNFAKGLIRHEFLREADLSLWLNSMGIECEFVGSSSTQQAQESDQTLPDTIPLQPAIFVHSIKQRRNTLDPAIDRSIETNGYDHNAIWIDLVKMTTDAKNPFIGLDEDGHIKYRGNRYEKLFEPDVLSKDALRERINRRRKKALQR